MSQSNGGKKMAAKKKATSFVTFETTQWFKLYGYVRS